jgi:hypothetical protein
MQAKGRGAAEIAEQTGIGRANVQGMLQGAGVDATPSYAP